MRFRFVLIIFMSLLFSVGALAKSSSEIMLNIKSSVISRTVSGAARILKTSNVEANGLQALNGPSVEFLLDVEYKGEYITLIPSDFTVIGSDTVKISGEDRVSVQLSSHHDGLPMNIYVNYYRLPEANYLQKSITVSPSKEAAGAILRRVYLDFWRFNKNLLPVDSGSLSTGARSDFGVVDTKKNCGFFFKMDSVRGASVCSGAGDLAIFQDANVPLEKGFESARATIGAAVGGPEAIYKQYREFVLSKYSYNLSKNKKLGEFRKKFEPYFQVCQYIRAPQEVKGVEMEGHVVDGKGFIILLNASDAPAKVALPLDNAALKLNGDIKLSDCTDLSSAVPLQALKAGEKAEVEIAPASARVIGVNMDSLPVSQ